MGTFFARLHCLYKSENVQTDIATIGFTLVAQRAVK